MQYLISVVSFNHKIFWLTKIFLTFSYSNRDLLEGMWIHDSNSESEDSGWCSSLQSVGDQSWIAFSTDPRPRLCGKPRTPWGSAQNPSCQLLHSGRRTGFQSWDPKASFYSDTCWPGQAQGWTEGKRGLLHPGSWLSPPPEFRPSSQPERLWIRLPFSFLLYLIMWLHSGFLNSDILPLSFVTLSHLILIDFTKIQFFGFLIRFCSTADFLKQTPNIERQYFPEVGWLVENIVPHVLNKYFELS